MIGGGDDAGFTHRGRILRNLLFNFTCRSLVCVAGGYLELHDLSLPQFELRLQVLDDAGASAETRRLVQAAPAEGDGGEGVIGRVLLLSQGHQRLSINNTKELPTACA